MKSFKKQKDLDSLYSDDSSGNILTSMNSVSTGLIDDNLSDYSEGNGINLVKISKDKKEIKLNNNDKQKVFKNDREKIRNELLDRKDNSSIISERWIPSMEQLKIKRKILWSRISDSVPFIWSVFSELVKSSLNEKKRSNDPIIFQRSELFLKKFRTQILKHYPIIEKEANLLWRINTTIYHYEFLQQTKYIDLNQLKNDFISILFQNLISLYSFDNFLFSRFTNESYEILVIKLKNIFFNYFPIEESELPVYPINPE